MYLLACVLNFQPRRFCGATQCFRKGVSEMKIKKIGKMYFVLGKIKNKYFSAAGISIDDCFSQLKQKTKECGLL
jgi:hypothetical protein